MKEFFKRLVLSPEGKASLTKIGGKIVAAASTEVTLALAGVIHVPMAVTAACIVIGILGGSISLDGLRDAIGKSKK